MQQPTISFNFGALRDSVFKLAAAELLRENTSKTLDSFTKTVKSTPGFMKQQFIYKNLQECKSFDKERLAERYIAQNLQTFKNESWNKILHENRALRKTLLEDMHVQAKGDTNTLCEAINTLIESTCNPNFNDIEKENNAYEVVLKHLTRPVVNESERSAEKDDAPNMKDTWKYVTQIAVNNFNERYAHLTESEQKVFKMLTSDIDAKKRYFQDIKTESLSLIDKKMLDETDMNTKNMLTGFKTKVESLNENELPKLDEYILSCVELKETLV